MSNRFEAFGETATGRALGAIIEAPELVAEYRALSEIGKPAVQAVAPHVSDIVNALPTKAERDAANQFCGWRVGQLMRGFGYQLVRARARVTGAPFKTGAVWAYRNDEVKVVRTLPQGVTRRIELEVRSSSGETVGAWNAVQSASDPSRRVHTFVESPRALEAALENARAYARQWNFGFVLIRDPQRLAEDDWWLQARANGTVPESGSYP